MGFFDVASPVSRFFFLVNVSESISSAEYPEKVAVDCKLSTSKA